MAPAKNKKANAPIKTITRQDHIETLIANIIMAVEMLLEEFLRGDRG